MPHGKKSVTRTLDPAVNLKKFIFIKEIKGFCGAARRIAGIVHFFRYSFATR
jgi:hypothetical protein